MGHSPDSERLQPPQGPSLTAHSTTFIVSHPVAESGQRHIRSCGIRLTEYFAAQTRSASSYLRFSSPSSGVAMARHSSMWPWNSLRTWPPVKKPAGWNAHHNKCVYCVDIYEYICWVYATWFLIAPNMLIVNIFKYNYKMGRSSTYINLCMCVYEFMCMKRFQGLHSTGGCGGKFIKQVCTLS